MPQTTTAREKHFFYTLLILVSVACVVIFLPFLTTIIIGASIAVVLYPVFSWLTTHIARGKKWLGALITLVGFIIVLGVPLFFIGMSVFNQSQSLYNSLGQDGTSQYIEKLSTSIESVLPEGMNFDVTARIDDFVSFLSSNISSIFTATLTSLFSFLLTLMALFYFLKDGIVWRKSIIELSPLSNENDDRILKKLSDAINGVMKGYLLIALVQGSLMGLGLWIFGVPNPALWGVLTGIASMIPNIGTALVSIPAILFLYFFGHTGSAIGLVIWSLVAVGGIDNILNPIIVGKNINLPPLVILFSVLGGITLMGASGILIGPLTVSLFYTLITIYKESFQVQ